MRNSSSFSLAIPASSKSLLPLSLLLLVTGSCNRAPQRPFEVVAVLPFDNLGGGTGDGTSDITGDVLATVATARTEGDTKARVFFARTLREAQSLRATRTVTGWYEEAQGLLNVHGSVRDEATGKAVNTFSKKGDLPSAAHSIAAATGAPVHEWPHPAGQALRAYGEARRAVTQESGLQKVNEALTADPSFGSAHLLRIELMLRMGARVEAQTALTQARESRLSEADRARLEVAAAQIEGSTTTQVKALSRLAALETANPQTMRVLLDTQFATRDFQGAAETAKRALELVPDDEDLLNRRGYAYAFAGDFDSATKSFADYRQKVPQSANAVDSLGEVFFYFRKYKEAAGLFSEAHRMNPSIVGGLEPFRSALSMQLAGQSDEADRQIQEFFAVRRKGGDPFVDTEEAIWSRIRRKPSSFPQDAPGLATAAFVSLADGDRATALELALAARGKVKNPSENGLVSIALQLAQPSAPAEVWRDRIAKAVTNPAQRDLRTELLGWALLLDKKYPEAASIWGERFASTSPLVNNDGRILLVWSLVEAGKLDEARKVMPQGWLPPQSLQPGLGALFYPNIVDLRTKF
ncbi:MAG: hypothetical protein H7039_04135 [Bryobacteraceae bacterium]|nr:hypothetical protein [Bryobacteraceae bacterium]